MRFLYLVVLFLISKVAYSNEYWTIEEFLKKYPEQKVLMEKLDEFVQTKGTPLKTKVKKVKIGIIYPGGQLSDYWVRSLKSFKARMDELGIQYELYSAFVDEDDIEKIKLHINSFLKNEIDYLIFTLDTITHKKILSQLINMDKPKLILQNITTPLKEWEYKQPFLYVGFDHIEGTKLLADYFKKNFPPGSKYLMLFYKDGYVSKMRGDQFIFLTKDRFTLAGAFFTHGKKDVAKEAVKKFFQSNSVDFIYSCSTDITIGAMEALSELKLKHKIALNGWGGGEKEIELILNGLLDVTVMRMNDDNGVAMAEAIKLDLLGEKVPVIYTGKFNIVDKSTSRDKIEYLKKQAFRYSK
ncbi:MAG: substrate-binding domain-containing protein [Calditerrivibrio sp.]|nr:substrate-binding domain-containing protein [Calditerrivibrio sp.]